MFVGGAEGGEEVGRRIRVGDWEGRGGEGRGQGIALWMGHNLML